MKRVEVEVITPTGLLGTVAAADLDQWSVFFYLKHNDSRTAIAALMRPQFRHVDTIAAVVRVSDYFKLVL